MSANADRFALVSEALEKYGATTKDVLVALDAVGAALRQAKVTPELPRSDGPLAPPNHP